MKISNPTFSLSVILILFLSSCDKVEPPYITSNHHPIDTSHTQHIKKILVEDYTGHLCVNCPAAHDVLAQLIDLYPNQIIPISLHVGSFATPINASYFGEDFRTQEGEELSNYFGNDAAGLPNGMVNRKEFSENKILSSDQWGTAISEVLQETQTMDFNITNTFDSTQRKLSTKVDISFLQDFTQTLYLCVYLIEDSIVGWQKDNRVNPEDIPDYMHRHVMRGSLNGTWGEKIIGTTSQSNIVTMQYNNFQLDTSFVPVHCSVVVFAYDSASYEIFQADEKAILDN